MQMILNESDATLFKEIAKLRYDVYCGERRYLNGSDYEDGHETDHYDHRSVHIAVKTRDDSGIGTVRLIMGSEVARFPFEQHCSLHPQFKRPPREQSAEVSRLIVRSDLRRLTGNPAQGTSNETRKKGGLIRIDEQTRTPAEVRRRIASPSITIELFRAMYRYSIKHDIRYWYVAMEKGLTRLLGRMGFQFVPIGPEADYYGPVTSYLGDLRKFEENLRQSNESTLAWFQDAPVSDRILISTIWNVSSSARTSEPRSWKEPLAA